MTALCRQLFKSNVYQHLPVLMHTNFVKSLIFCYKDNQKVEHYIAGTLSQMSIVSKFIIYQFTWICVKGM